jgi:hypothetical protein
VEFDDGDGGVVGDGEDAFSGVGGADAEVVHAAGSSEAHFAEGVEDVVAQSVVAGLMSHVVYPEEAGFVLAEVWRGPDEGQTYLDTVVRPLMSELGRSAGETTVSQVWSFARP